MKRQCQLYIAGRQVDLGDDSWILFNWEREDLSNPTAVVNSSSHQIELPGTCRNNSLFGSVFRLDRRTLFGIRYDGADFDPTRKTPFVLYDSDGSVLESGYCRLDSVNTKSRKHAYTISLFGGLGGFFYSLSADESGNAMTLGDLIWTDMMGNDLTDFEIQPLASYVQEAWDVLQNGVDEEEAYLSRIWNVVNFAPAYNGLPEDFDASHALMSADAYANIPEGVDEDDQRPYEYTYKAGCDSALVSFTNSHTEWEVGDLRAYLQRPVVSVKAFISAICDSRNNGGYTVTLDESFFHNDNPYYADAWWTLPMIAVADRGSVSCLNNLMKSSKTPMAYLVDYCKIFGLMFLWDSARKIVRIVTRATFYGEQSGNVIDLSSRIDRSQEINQDPTLADHRWYQLGDGGEGEFVDQYKIDYGSGFATQKIDTGYEFDSEVSVLTDDQTFKDAAEVMESNRMFSAAEVLVSGRTWTRYFQLPKWEGVTVELWSDSGEAKTFDVECSVDTTYYDNSDHPFADWLPKVQLHGSEEKGLDGSDVLLFFDGFKSTPVYSSGSWNVRKSYYLTDDSATMSDLAGGSCWDLTRTGIQVLSLPSFRRNVVSGKYIIYSLEWGVPSVRPVYDIAYPSGSPTTIYDLWWKGYLTDRYDVDSRVLTAMVDLRGLAVGQDLLRRFYWIDGALWTLNAIRNHSLTSWDLTECEFVKVKAKRNYTTGPWNLGSEYLEIIPGGVSYAFSPSGESLELTVNSSSAWSLSSSASPDWLVLSTTSGSSGSSTLTITLPANSSGGRRLVSITITNADGISKTFNISQAIGSVESISVSPSSITIPASGTSISGQASRGKAARVTATSAWAVDYTTVPEWLYVSTSLTGVSMRADANSGGQLDASIKIYITADPTIFATLSVTQEAGEEGVGGITLLDGNGNSTYTASADGETLTLILTIPDADGWTITTENLSFASVSPLSGSDNATISVVIDENTGSSQLSGTIKATRDGYTDGAVFYLYQAAQAASSDYIYITRRYNFAENNVSVGNSIEYEGFDVYASGAWTVTSDKTWVHVYGGAWSGNAGSGMVKWFYTDANSGSQRTAKLTATLTATGDEDYFYIYQEGDGSVTMDASLSKTTIDSTAQEIYLKIVGTEGLAWEIDNVSAGLTPESYSGTIGFNGYSEVTVDVGSTSSRRTLSLRVKNTTYSIYKTLSVTQNAPAASDYLYVSPFGDVAVAATDTSKRFAVECSTSWQVVSSSSSVSISPSTGSGNLYVDVTFPYNQTSSQKTYPLVFSTTSGTTISVPANIKQAAASSNSISATPSSASIPSTGGSVSVSVVSSGSWTASKSDSWITISNYSGSSGTTSVSISASRNDGVAHDGTVTFTCGTATAVVSVSQGTAADLEVSSNAVSLGSGSGESESVMVYGSGMWDIWEYSDIPLWLSVTYQSHAGSESGEVITFTTRTENTSATSNSVTIRLVLSDNTSVYEDIVVTQSGQSTLYVSPSSIYVNAYQGSGTLTVTCNTDWHISSIDSGVIIADSVQSGTGDGVVPWYVEGNPNVGSRVLTIVFVTDDGEKTASVDINQAAGMLYFDAEELIFAANGESQTVALVSSDAWTVDETTVPAWLSVSPLGGSQIGQEITFTASEYSGSSDRTATVVVANQYGATTSISIVQRAVSSHTLTISPTEVHLADGNAATGSFTITSDTSWTIEVDTTDSGGLSVSASSGSGTRTLTWSVPANSWEYYLTHTIKVRSTDGGIVRSLEVWQPPASGSMITFTPDTDSLTFYATAPEATKTFSIKVIALEDWIAYANGLATWCVFDVSQGTANEAAVVTFTPTISTTEVQTVEWVVETTNGYTRSITITTLPEG